MNDYLPLSVRSPREAVLTLAKSESHAELTDPAETLLTDLRVAPGVVVPATEPLDETRRLMQLAGVRMAFVVESGGGVIGLVTAADLQGERPMLVARARSISTRELTVMEVVTPVAQWTTVDIGSLAIAQVGNIVATMRSAGQRYLIVTERVVEGASAGAKRTVVRGLFSANRLERALGHPIEVELRSHSFAELAAALTYE